MLRDERLLRPSPIHICTVGPFNSIAHVLRINGTAGFTNGGWLANNRAVYVPIFMPMRFTVARFLSANNNATGNTDIGLYSNAGTRLMSTGSTGRTGAPAVQYIGVTDQSFGPGKYYLAMVCSSTSGSIFRATADFQSDLQACGVLEESLGATTLPTTMTPAAYSSQLIYMFGFSQSDTL